MTTLILPTLKSPKFLVNPTKAAARNKLIARLMKHRGWAISTETETIRGKRTPNKMKKLPRQTKKLEARLVF